jgi:hypothetical protein
LESATGAVQNKQHCDNSQPSTKPVCAADSDDFASWPCEIPTLPEDWFFVECGLNGDCFYHSLSWLCDRCSASRELNATVSLAQRHVLLRALILKHMHSRGSSILLNAEEFGYESIGQASLRQWISSNERMDIDEYISVHSKLHQFAGYPELVAWTSFSNRPLIVIEQHKTFKVTLFRPVNESNVRVQRGCWAEAVLEMQHGSFCLLQQGHHWMAIVPKSRLSSSCPNPSERPKAWAHFISRPITYRNALLEKEMPIIDLSICQAQRPK